MESEQKDSQETHDTPDPGPLSIGDTVFVVVVLLASIFVLAVALYLLKMALGIDVFSKVHFGKFLGF